MKLRGPGGFAPRAGLPPPRPPAEAAFASARHMDVIAGFARGHATPRGAAGFVAQFLAQEVIGHGLDLPRRREARLAYAPAAPGSATLFIET